MSTTDDVHRGRVAIVTGGASGIGLATAVHLARRGATVVAADIDTTPVVQAVEDAARAGHALTAHRVDVTDRATIDELVAAVVDRHGGVDLLFNGAAATGPNVVGRDAAVTDLPDDVWQRSVDVNLTGTMAMCRACIPSMVERGGGAIVNMVSVAAFAGNVSLTSYAATKAGVVGLTRSVATQYGRSGVRCNAIAAGFVRTPATTANLSPAVEEIVRRNTLVGFLGEAEDVAAVASFLLSDAARYITGETIRVDGGQLAHVPTYDALTRLGAAGDDAPERPDGGDAG
jgi:NAD(P)-dependent dehydrogenase (short-subunit alcohol dehydrogenase family)